MLTEFKDEIKNSHNRLVRLLLALLAIAAVVAVLPRKAQFKYEFEKGKPWLHEDLIAPFQFPVLKTDAQMQSEIADIQRRNRFYFVYQSKIEEEAVNRLRVGIDFEFADQDSVLTEKMKTDAVAKLHKIYEKDVIDLPANVDIPEIVNVVRGRVEERVPLKALYTAKSAAAWIEAQFSQNPSEDSMMLRNLIVENIRPNLIYDSELSQKIFGEKVSQISKNFGKVAKSEKIISRGEIVDAETYQKLEAFKRAYLQGHEGQIATRLLIGGQIFLVAVGVFVLLFYMAIYQQGVFNELNKFTLVLVFFTLWVYMASLSLYFDEISIYMLPFCIMPLVIRNFFDARLASFLYTITILLIGFLAPNPFQFVFIQLMTGLVALFTITGMRKRSQFITSAVVIFVTYSALFYAFSIMKEGSFEHVDHSFLYQFGTAALLTLPAYPIIFLFEKMFKLISDVTLLELSDTNNIILRKLNLKAPGTFQHSLQVANLSEEAANAVGADALLVRTGALYHDIGKMKNPAYFIENQSGTGNPHDDLGNQKSSEIIIKHVLDGVELAHAISLPEQIIDFIRTHHGTTCTRYFYNMAKKEDADCDIADYRYPGPIPFSKETAILMMADSVEAASRSLKKYDGETIDHLVDGIVSNQLAEDQFINADITLKDISMVKKIFKRRLKSIYHVRISYPEA